MSGSDTYLPTAALGGASENKFRSGITLLPAKFVPPPPKGGNSSSYGVPQELNMEDGTEDLRGKGKAPEVEQV